MKFKKQDRICFWGQSAKIVSAESYIESIKEIFDRCFVAGQILRVGHYKNASHSRISVLVIIYKWASLLQVLERSRVMSKSSTAYITTRPKEHRGLQRQFILSIRAPPLPT